MGGVIRAVLGALRGSQSRKVVIMSGHVVARDTTSLLQQRGWRQKGKNTWVGPYATAQGTWDGYIERAGDRTRVFIKNPPMGKIALHPKSICFHTANDGWVQVNLHQEPIDGDVNSIIQYIERVLIECHKLAGRS